MRYLAEISYDGSAYKGFQLQPEPTLTVQFVLERAMCQFLGVSRDRLVVQAASRTDAGVHARQQYVEFYSPRQLGASKFCRCINALLPEDVAVHSLERIVDEGFNVRHSQGKLYSYDLHTDTRKDAFLSRYRKVHATREPLDLDRMRLACELIMGDHDFQLLSANGPGSTASAASTVRRVFSVEVVEIDRGIRIRVHGKGFLHKMVRNIVGVLLAVGGGHLDLDDVAALLRADDEAVRERRIKSRYKVAEGKGLCLERVYLSDRSFDRSVVNTL